MTMFAQPVIERRLPVVTQPRDREPLHAPLPNASDEIQTLAQQLLQQAAAQPFSASLGLAEGNVLLDLELNGFRCVLIRMAKPLPEFPAEPPHVLSPRELEIARMIAKGYPNKAIAAVLEISAWTVCTHIRRIFAKLGVGSRAAMVARLGEDGLLPTAANSINVASFTSGQP
jgi:DNA-binding NarL/FixJ family response regulator